MGIITMILNFYYRWFLYSNKNDNKISTFAYILNLQLAVRCCLLMNRFSMASRIPQVLYNLMSVRV